jgi:myxalamid-type polyketide synthase MxaE and MxaD
LNPTENETDDLDRLTRIHARGNRWLDESCDDPGQKEPVAQAHISIAYGRSGMLASDGRCKFGDALADGYVRSEGTAVLVLKSEEMALRDGDRIFAVILRSAVNNDGGSNSFGTPCISGPGRSSAQRGEGRRA